MGRRGGDGRDLEHGGVVTQYLQTSLHTSVTGTSCGRVVKTSGYIISGAPVVWMLIDLVVVICPGPGVLRTTGSGDGTPLRRPPNTLSSPVWTDFTSFLPFVLITSLSLKLDLSSLAIISEFLNLINCSLGLSSR